MKKLLLFIFLTFCFTAATHAQMPDSIINKKTKDTILKTPVQKFEPRKATIRSAIFPGWGQIYNKKYWKLPLVWGALGITAGTYFYNVKYYRLLRKAYIYRSDTDATNDDLVDPQFRNLSTESIRSYRNSFRQNVDYSVLFFILNLSPAGNDGRTDSGFTWLKLLYRRF